MKRERFEELLSDKLQDFSVAPPEGLFDRISASLEEIPAAPAPVVRRRIPTWRYVSAAAALMIVVGTAWIVVEHSAEESKALLAPTTLAERTPQVAPPVKHTPQTEQTTTTEQTATEQNNITDRLRALFVEEAIAQEELLAQAENPIESTSLQESIATQPTEAQLADNTTTHIEGPQLEDAPRAKRQAGQGGDPDEAWRRMMAEQRAAERRGGGGLVASLYGGNNGSMGIGSLNHRGVASLMNNNMMVSEATDNLFSAIPQRAPQEAKLKHSMPISIGVGLSVPLTNRLSVETGLEYNYLHSSSSNEQAMSTYAKKRHLHYVGIPVSVNYNIINSNSFNLYSRAGMTIEKGVAGRDVVLMDGKEISSTDIEIKGIQPSVDLSLGAMFSIDNIGLYVEPGLEYYFETASQPASYRTENPVGFSLKVGLKYLFGKDK